MLPKQTQNHTQIRSRAKRSAIIGFYSEMLQDIISYYATLGQPETPSRRLLPAPGLGEEVCGVDDQGHRGMARTFEPKQLGSEDLGAEIRDPYHQGVGGNPHPASVAPSAHPVLRRPSHAEQLGQETPTGPAATLG